MMTGTIHHCLQGSEAWDELRRGKITASRFKSIITAKKGERSSSAADYIAELLTPSFFENWAKFLGNDSTDHGTEHEPLARDAFQEQTGLKVVQLGFITMKDHPLIGYSPDGLIVGPDGEYQSTLEMKCPQPHTHIRWFMAGTLPDVHKAQVHGSMAVTGLDEAHFYSYCEGLAPLHIVVHRDAYTESLTNSIIEFEAEYCRALDEFLPKLEPQPKPE